MAPGNADLIRPIYVEWGRFEIFADRAKALESVRAARSKEREPVD